MISFGKKYGNRAPKNSFVELIPKIQVSILFLTKKKFLDSKNFKEFSSIPHTQLFFEFCKEAFPNLCYICRKKLVTEEDDFHDDFKIKICRKCLKKDENFLYKNELLELVGSYPDIILNNLPHIQQGHIVRNFF